MRITVRDKGSPTPSWIIEDAGGHRLGTITHAVGFGFLVHTAQGTPLRGVDFGPHETLKAAVQARGVHLNATCIIKNDK